MCSLQLFSISYPEAVPEASKWLSKAPPGTVLTAVPVPVLQQMENTDTCILWHYNL